jgi:hypothetical protein
MALLMRRRKPLDYREGSKLGFNSIRGMFHRVATLTNHDPNFHAPVELFTQGVFRIIV